MAKRPKLNLNSTHFKDSYKTEIESLKLQAQIVREVTQMQMKKEFDSNNFIREYLERTYRVVMDQVEGKWGNTKPENLDKELRNRENFCKNQLLIQLQKRDYRRIQRKTVRSWQQL